MFRQPDDTTSMPATVLLVNLDESTEEGQTIRKLLEDRQIRWIDLDASSLDKTIAENLGSDALPPMDPTRPVGHEAEPEDVTVPDDVALMVMASFSREELEDLLESYRETEAPPIRLKAVATHNNLHWKLRSLAFELEREHQTMSLYGVLYRGVKAVEMMDDQEYTPESWAILEAAAVKAADCVNKLRNQEEVPIPHLRETWLGFQDAINRLVPNVKLQEDPEEDEVL